MKPRIHHLPFKRSLNKGEVTIAIWKSARVYAGISVCSKRDHFQKKIGRVKAVARLNNPREQFEADSELSLCGKIVRYLGAIEQRHPGTISDQTIYDLSNLFDSNTEDF